MLVELVEAERRCFQSLWKCFCTRSQIDDELLCARIAEAWRHGILDPIRFQTYRKNVFSVIAPCFGDIETQKVLAFQILFDCLKDWRQIILLWQQGRFRIADEKIFSTSFLGEVLEAFAGWTHCEPSIAW